MRKITELVAMLVIGDGVIAAPRRHGLLWRFGPEGYGHNMEALAERPAAADLAQPPKANNPPMDDEQSSHGVPPRIARLHY